jgi:uncharacterized membrane protein YoaK (UPF0700 family)
VGDKLVKDIVWRSMRTSSFEARHRAKHTWPVIIGFTAGAGLGAACFAAAGLKSLGLPAGLALFALVTTNSSR